MWLLGSGRNFYDFGHFQQYWAKYEAYKGNLAWSVCVLGEMEVFPRHITSLGVDLGSVLLETSEGQNREYFAPPETFLKNFCSIGNFFRKWISGVDLMHFGPIERILSPKIDFDRGGVKVSKAWGNESENFKSPLPVIATAF